MVSSCLDLAERAFDENVFQNISLPENSEHVRTAVQMLTLAEAAAFLPASRSGSLPRAAALRSSATSALAKSFARCPDSALIAPLASSAFCSASCKGHASNQCVPHTIRPGLAWS